MNRKMVVAVIDSGVDVQDSLLIGRDIQALYYEDQEFKTCYMGNLNSHGTEIVKVLLREAPEIKILSIRTLREDNRCMLMAIVNSIKFCIEQKVDVINLSLGSCSPTTKRLKDLKEVCDLAVENGIVIFAADHNMYSVKSYPANFKNVIGVTTQYDAKDYCKIFYKDMVVEFSDNMVYVPDYERCVVRKGNSYLCPFLVGLYCRFIDRNKNYSDKVESFMDFLKNFSKKETISRIYFDKYDKKEQYLFSGKKVLFFTDDMDLNNMNLFDMYQDIADISLCFEDVYTNLSDQVEKKIEDADIFLIGALSNSFIHENEGYIEKLIEMLVRKKIQIITVFPIISTYQRMELASHTGGYIKSIYK